MNCSTGSTVILHSKISIDTIEPMKRKHRRGGARLGTGPKKHGRKPYLIRMKPETMAVILGRMGERGLKVIGEVLEQDYVKDNRSNV
jgi:hypothetical protein